MLLSHALRTVQYCRFPWKFQSESPCPPLIRSPPAVVEICRVYSFWAGKTGTCPHPSDSYDPRYNNPSPIRRESQVVSGWNNQLVSGPGGVRIATTAAETGGECECWTMASVMCLIKKRSGLKSRTAFTSPFRITQRGYTFGSHYNVKYSKGPKYIKLVINSVWKPITSNPHTFACRKYDWQLKWWNCLIHSYGMFAGILLCKAYVFKFQWYRKVWKD